MRNLRARCHPTSAVSDPQVLEYWWRLLKSSPETNQPDESLWILLLGPLFIFKLFYFHFAFLIVFDLIKDIEQALNESVLYLFNKTSWEKSSYMSSLTKSWTWMEKYASCESLLTIWIFPSASTWKWAVIWMNYFWKVRKIFEGVKKWKVSGKKTQNNKAKTQYIL